MLDVSTPEARRKFYNSMAWRNLRDEILSRDNFECQWCKAEGKVSTRFNTIIEVDHIKELEHYPELAMEPSNLRCLCKECHNKRHNRFEYKSRQKPKKWDDESFD